MRSVQIGGWGALFLLFVPLISLGCEDKRKARRADCELARESLGAKFLVRTFEGNHREWFGDVGHHTKTLDDWGEARGSVQSDSVRHTGDVYAAKILEMTTLLRSVRDIEIDLMMGSGMIDQMVRSKREMEKLSEKDKERLIALELQSEAAFANFKSVCQGELTIDSAEAATSPYTAEMQKTVLRWKAEDEEAIKKHRQGTLGKPATKTTQAKPSPAYSDLPEILLKKVPFSLEQKAMKLNGAALKQHQEGLFAEAQKGFAEAVRTNPGHLLARYNLSCALARQNKPDEAFRVLKTFRRVDCPGCIERLKRAQADSDWNGLRDDPRFKEITGNLTQLGEKK